MTMHIHNIMPSSLYHGSLYHDTCMTRLSSSKIPLTPSTSALFSSMSTISILASFVVPVLFHVHPAITFIPFVAFIPFIMSFRTAYDSLCFLFFITSSPSTLHQLFQSRPPPTLLLSSSTFGIYQLFGFPHSSIILTWTFIQLCDILLFELM
ncbi:hypothetical protein M408DRAFT_234558 [Serendipita vermifera MAFF 305830]|uniref:Uncharacterized protein n=1 Tax=Serendipita vermifera MAFF 305830 TaxID=933852 RepID=A0A0C3AI44_SERVB|nr:hypothetical protein M408DRAFT_234558 [Serendipita vermifera MAFF 305830]